jgi:AcrR family transcriptional regulator
MALKLDERPASTPRDMLAAARRRFLHGEKLDINGLAEELGISRATAYRWAGNVEELTGFVIASLASDTFHRSLREAEGEGVERLIDANRRGLRYIASGPYREWLSREDPEKALRIVASKSGPAQGTTVRLWEELLTREVENGNVELPVSPHAMAYAIVRISESFLYADLIAGDEPDIDSCLEIIKLLLR